MSQRLPAQPGRHEAVPGTALARPQPVARDAAALLPDGAGDAAPHAGDEAERGAHGAAAPEDLRGDRPDRLRRGGLQAHRLPGAGGGRGHLRPEPGHGGVCPGGAVGQTGGQEAAGERQDGEEAGGREGLLLLPLSGVQAGVRPAGGRRPGDRQLLAGGGPAADPGAAGDAAP